jgi:D-glycero-alpha-D-manno-heptose-7-phosphate kinase
MLITRTPLRISLGGGGTDLPSYYEAAGGGFLIAAAINKYIYIAIHDNFVDRYLIKYSHIEDVQYAHEIVHPLIREAMTFTATESGVEITSIADIPAGTGLGSSGTFTVGLLKALYARQHKHVSNLEIAKQACHLEIERLCEPVGKQDQYIAAVGGLTSLTFHPDGTVDAASLRMDPLARKDLDEHLILFYTGVQRRAADELAALHEGASVEESSIRMNLDRVRELGRQSAAVLERGDLDTFGRLLTEQWQLKFERAPTTVHQKIDGWLTAGIEAGARGGKLVGAGGGGFLLFMAEDKSRVRRRMRDLGLREIDFSIDYDGSRTML